MSETNIRDWAEHRRTYAAFLRLTKGATAAVVVLLVLMATFLLHH